MPPRRLFHLLVIAMVGCSPKGPITSKRVALETTLLALEQARKVAANLRPDKLEARTDVEPVVHGEAPFEPANTLVMGDTEIEQLGREASCAGKNPGCDDGGFGVGNLCTLDAASVLRFDRFRDSVPPAREYSAQCAQWLESVKYVLVVHVDERAEAKVETRARGHAVLVELASGQGLARLTFDASSRGTLSGPVVRDSKRLEPDMVQYVHEYATPVNTLVAMELGKKLREVFPRAKITRWPLIQPKAS
jgi:hypothetical protein